MQAQRHDHQYCEKKAFLIGSPEYYAVRRAKIAQQPLLTALFALNHTFQEMAQTHTEKPIAQAKFDWWQDELQALAQGLPSHPISKVLASAPAFIEENHTQINALHQAYAQDLSQIRYFDWHELNIHLNRTGGYFAQLLANVCNPTADQSWAIELGQHLQFAHYLQAIGKQLQYGKIYIPVHELEKFNVSVISLKQKNYQQNYQQLMQHLFTQTQTAIQTLLNSLTKQIKNKQKPLIAIANIDLATLEEIKINHFSILHQEIKLTPIRHFWLSWRHTI